MRLLLRRRCVPVTWVAVFGVARAASTSGRGLPPVMLVAAGALASFVPTVGASAEAGIRDTAWRAVGADARVDLTDGSAAGRPGRSPPSPGCGGSSPRRSPTRRGRDRRRLRLDTPGGPGRVRIRRDARRHDGAGCAATGADERPAGGGVPALVRSADGSLRPGMRLELRRTGEPATPLIAVGTAPRRRRRRQRRPRGRHGPCRRRDAGHTGRSAVGAPGPAQPPGRGEQRDGSVRDRPVPGRAPGLKGVGPFMPGARRPVRCGSGPGQNCAKNFHTSLLVQVRTPLSV